MPTTPPGSPPRWPPVNQRRDDGAGGGGPGRKMLIFALIGALVVLTACAGVAYFAGVFPAWRRGESATATERSPAIRPIRPGRIAHRDAGADHDYWPRHAYLDTRADEDAQARRDGDEHPCAYTDEHAFIPSLTVTDLIVYPVGGGRCTGNNQVKNNGPQDDSWDWEGPDIPLPSSFRWGCGRPRLIWALHGDSVARPHKEYNAICIRAH